MSIPQDAEEPEGEREGCGTIVSALKVQVALGPPLNMWFQLVLGVQKLEEYQ